ncbi:hypothetical protein CDAR_273151 [Caerostris darwini]|uniref:Uncharacterized protein n=1 Tax=Caerostris darwini TaxID=1538125 RepID=A0AAV4MFI1_9ARAC|nr:hypothetical protein CDAR_273151 [Caerostris darwini]
MEIAFFQGPGITKRKEKDKSRPKRGPLSRVFCSRLLHKGGTERRDAFNNTIERNETIETPAASIHRESLKYPPHTLITANVTPYRHAHKNSVNESTSEVFRRKPTTTDGKREDLSSPIGEPQTDLHFASVVAG